MYHEFVSVAVAIQHSKRTPNIIICSLSGSIVIFHLINYPISEKKKLLNINMFRFSLQRLSETFLILIINQSDFVLNVNRSLCKEAIILTRFLLNCNFLDIFSKKYL